MVKFEVITTVEEMIKPSSPTPAHLKSFKLSVLDQLVTTVYAPLWFFYPNSNHGQDFNLSFKLATLKDALSKILTLFYPLAGRLRNSTSIDCNDEGAIFMQAKVVGSHDMLPFLERVQNSEFELLYKLLPCPPTLTCPVEEAAQVLVKVNVFPCGSIAIGMCLLYIIVDGTFSGSFIKKWAEIARSITVGVGGQDHNHLVNAYRSSTINVLAVASSLFPPNENLSTRLAEVGSVPISAEEKKNAVRKMFAFDAKAISVLKSKARSKNVPTPTRVEVISGLLWKCMARISSFSASGRTPSFLINFVNVRSKLEPPLPEHSIGNMYWLAIAKDDHDMSEDDEDNKDLAYYVDLLRKSFNEIDSNYLKNMQGEQGFKRICKFHEDAQKLYSKSGLILEVSSCNRLGYYEADFGWGEPSWVTSAPYGNNEILLIETKSRDGMEALVMLDVRRMTMLQHDPDIQAYTTTTNSSFITCNL